jgi:hypothetical protein
MTDLRPPVDVRAIARPAVLAFIAFVVSTTLVTWLDLLIVTGAAAWIVFLLAALRLTGRIVDATAHGLGRLHAHYRAEQEASRITFPPDEA